MRDLDGPRISRECRDTNEPRQPAADTPDRDTSVCAAGTLSVRFATAGDIESFYGQLQQPTLRALVVEMRGDVVGLVGLARRGSISIFFSEVRTELRPHLKRMVALRAIKRAMKWVEQSAVPVFAIAQEDEPQAPALLVRLGFEPVSEDLYRWRS